MRITIFGGYATRPGFLERGIGWHLAYRGGRRLLTSRAWSIAASGDPHGFNAIRSFVSSGVLQHGVPSRGASASRDTAEPPAKASSGVARREGEVNAATWHHGIDIVQPRGRAPPAPKAEILAWPRLLPQQQQSTFGPSFLSSRDCEEKITS